MITFNNSGVAILLKIAYCVIEYVQEVHNGKFAGNIKRLYETKFPEKVFNYTLVSNSCEGWYETDYMRALKNNYAEISSGMLAYTENTVRYGPPLYEDYNLVSTLYTRVSLFVDVADKFRKIIGLNFVVISSIFQLILLALLNFRNRSLSNLIFNFASLTFLQHAQIQARGRQRIYFSSWIIYMTLVICIVSATFSIDLKVEDYSDRINKLEDIMAKKKLPLWRVGSVALTEFQQGTLPLRRELYEYAKKVGLQKCLAKGTSPRDLLPVFSERVLISTKAEFDCHIRAFCSAFSEVKQTSTRFLREGTERYSITLKGIVLSQYIDKHKEAFINKWFLLLGTSGLVSFNFQKVPDAVVPLVNKTCLWQRQKMASQDQRFSYGNLRLKHMESLMIGFYSMMILSALFFLFIILKSKCTKEKGSMQRHLEKQLFRLHSRTRY